MSAVKLTVGGVQRELPPLTFGALKRHREVLRQLAEGGIQSADELFTAMAGVVLESVQRVDKAVTLAELEEALDWPTCKLAFDHVMVASFPAVQPGEPAAASPSGASTGTS